MTGSEFEEKKRYILEIQARFDSGMKRLEESMSRLEDGALKRLGASGTLKNHKRLIDIIRRLENL